jgi:tetratricopeptide (TPR) repeat protein
MKRFLCFLLVGFLPMPSLPAAEEATLDSKEKKSLDQNEKKRTDEESEKGRNKAQLYRECAMTYGRKDLDKALEKVNTLEKHFPGDPNVANLKGAIHADRKEFDLARKWYEIALERDKESFAAMYNLADIPFLQGDYKRSRKEFIKLAVAYPKIEISQYRVVLGYLLTNQIEKAQGWLDDKMTFPSNTAAYYYANFCIQYAKKNYKEAQKFLNGAESVFGMVACYNFAQPLEAIGWIKKEEDGRLVMVAEEAKPETP